MFFAIFAVAVQGETQFPHQLRPNTCRAVLIQNTQIQAWTSSGNSTRRHRRDALRCVVDMLTWSWHVDLKLTFWHVFYMLAIRWHFELKLWCWYVVVGMIQESESTYVQKNCNKKDMIATRYICKLNLFDPQVIWHQTMCLKLWQDKRQF